MRMLRARDCWGGNRNTRSKEKRILRIEIAEQWTGFLDTSNPTPGNYTIGAGGYTWTRGNG